MRQTVADGIRRVTGKQGPFSAELEGFFNAIQTKYASVNVFQIPDQDFPILMEIVQLRGIPVEPQPTPEAKPATDTKNAPKKSVGAGA